jgi:hypothetical protein
MGNVNYLDANLHDTTSNSERTNRQRKVGQFLEKLIEEIERENEVNRKIDINSPEFDLSTENIEIIETKLFKENYKLNLLKMKY